uniref:OmpA family protein n=1 Tax=uncultured Thiotrichaceae bacterium TaxID=298394 RepID=A0A6S6TYE7_9GAMM|nr:MAG: OmpA family protein [uncultured Thiotrichaceae bacterium]
MQSESNILTASCSKPAEQDMQRLRDLLLGKDYEALLELRRQINTPELHSEKIAGVVSEALQLRAGQDETLSVVLSPTIENALSRSIESNPQRLADALYPVMGPAIRKSIQEALTQTFETFNQLLEQSLSPKFLGWRFDAWRTGRSYSEVVLLNTLEYQVEQVFLIHGETGLLLRHAEALNAISKDPDMVSGMLTAIQDFIADSFSVQDGASLKKLRLGELTVLIERGPYAVLAAVVRGDPPGDLTELLAETQETIHQQMANTLVSYEGDSEPFVRIHHLIEACLLSQRQQRVKSKPWITYFLLITLLSLAAYWGYQHYKSAQDELALERSQQQASAQALLDEQVKEGELQRLLTQAKHQQEQAFIQRVDKMNAEPGVVVINTEKSEQGYQVKGLLDPLARHPKTFIKQMPLASEAGLQDVDVTIDYSFQPYFSAEPEMVLKRAYVVLKPPKSIVLSLSNGVFRVSGEAGQRWRGQLENYWRSMPGVNTLDDSRLKMKQPQANVKAAVDKLLGEINREKYLFDNGVVTVDEASTHFVSQARDIRQLLQMTAVSGQRVQITLTGHTDSKGSVQLNEEISVKRAEHARSYLIRQGVPASIISISRDGVSGKNERSVSYFAQVY